MNNADKQAEFQGRQQRAMVRLMVECRQLIPTDWREAILEIDRNDMSEGSRTIKHRLHNKITGEEIFNFSDRMFIASSLLHGLYSRYDMEWNHCILTMWFDDAGKVLDYEATFE